MAKRFLPLLILLLALLIQTNYLLELRNGFPDFLISEPFCGVDAVAHRARAVGIIDGSVPGDKVFYFIPLYPLYLAGLNLLVGESLLLPVFGQALLQLVGIAALYSIGRIVYSWLTGALAALGLATYSYYHFYLPCFDQALLTTPFLLLAVFFLIKYHVRRQPLYILGAGAAFAAAGLSRPTVLTLLPAVVPWLFWIRKSLKRFVKNVVLLALPVVVALAPFTWHNYTVEGQFVLLSNNFGINLFTGNNPDAYGMDSLAHVQTQPAVPRFKETLRRVHSGETTFAAEALAFMRKQPADALALMVRKTWLWFGETEKLLIEPFFPLTVARSKTLARLPLQWQALMTMALLGVFLVPGRSLTRTSSLWLICATFSIFTIIFFIQFRFRLSFVPFVILSAAALLAAAPRWSLEKPFRFWMVFAIFLLLVLFVPGLSFLTLLFAALGLWPLLRRHRKPLYRWVAAATGLYLVLVAIWWQATALASDVSQNIDIYRGPPLAAPGILGQTFQMDCDGLNRIDITFGTFGDYPDQPVTFNLAASPSAEEILYAETFDAASLEDYERRTFRFEPVGPSAGQSFFFFLSSPTSTPADAVTARGYSDTPVDHYPSGAAFAGQLGNLQRLQADFAFRATCDLSVWQKLKAVFDPIWSTTGAEMTRR